MRSGFRHLHDENFDYDPLTGVRQKLTIDNDGVFHFVTEQDDEDIRRFAHESRSNFSKYERFSDITPVGSIPVVVLYDLIRRGIWNDPDRKRKWWNSIEAAPYRTRDFRL
jgi:hypothetical protein